ncbi:hypothetical protein NFHSH190041_13560 [Shewanella sp. NFH-SH190041]|nr:hypothetical protein NFHSH190041_13560 [Shewanella sp. NFH-SH190041]
MCRKIWLTIPVRQSDVIIKLSDNFNRQRISIKRDYPLFDIPSSREDRKYFNDKHYFKITVTKDLGII